MLFAVNINILLIINNLKMATVRIRERRNLRKFSVIDLFAGCGFKMNGEFNLITMAQVRGKEEGEYKDLMVWAF